MSQKVDSVVSVVRERIVPSKTKQEDIKKKLAAIVEKINDGLSDATALLGGSIAKNTWLDGFDTDIFVVFEYEKYKDLSHELSDLLEKHLTTLFGDVERLHGSRDYFQISEEGLSIEVIPILKIERAQEAKNITDISPLHTLWVSKHDKGDDIRLMKKFCRAHGAYGAESYIKGFSGYVCEILTIHYGSFVSLVKSAAKWKDTMVIDPEEFHKGKNVALELNQSKLLSPLIVIDPVDATRNAAAALSEEKYNAFIDACKDFLKDPTEDAFEEKSVDVHDLKSQHKNGVVIHITAKPVRSGKRDVVGGQLLKVFDFAALKTQEYGFEMYDARWEWDTKEKVDYYFVLKDEELAEEVVVVGPPVSMAEHVENFKKIHKVTREEKGHIIAIEKRKHTSALGFFKEIVKEKYVLERVSDLVIEEI